LDIPILFPSMWAGEQAVVGDLLVVAWNVQGRRGGCFRCLRPETDRPEPPAEAQPGLRADVQRVASLAAATALALLLSGSPQQVRLTEQLRRGVNYFLVPRWPPTVQTVRTRRRRDCRFCSAVRSAGITIRGAAGVGGGGLRDWAVGLGLASATLWHQAIPGLDALTTLAFIAAASLWWRNRLPSFAEVSSRLRSLGGDQP